MASGTTNLADLPIAPLSNEPVQLKTTEMNVKVDDAAAQLQQQREKDTVDMNTLVTGVQTANAVGALNLPSRDIPQSQQHIIQDTQIKPNYIPSDEGDYISQEPSTSDIIKKNAEEQRQKDNTDELFNTLQIPIMISLLYFAFQMPVFRKLIFEKLPYLFEKDGNFSTLGSGIISILFAGAYIGTTRLLDYLSI